MKKLIPIAAAAALLLTACSSGNYAATEIPAKPQPSVASAAPPATQPGLRKPAGVVRSPTGRYRAGPMPAGTTMAKIKERGRLIAGVSADSLNLGSRNPLTGQIEGFDIDMINAVADGDLRHRRKRADRSSCG